MKAIHVFVAIALTTSAFASTPPAPAKASSIDTKAKPAAAKVAEGKTIIADVDGIVCAFCVQGIQKIFHSKGKADEVVISLESKKVCVKEKEGQTITNEEFTETIRHAGFKTMAINRSNLSIDEVKSRIAHKQPLVTQAAATGSGMHTASR